MNDEDDILNLHGHYQKCVKVIIPKIDPETTGLREIYWEITKGPMI